MKQFNWPEMMEFWKNHGASWSEHNDFEKDPDGLNVVLYPGASKWLNRYFAHFQRKIYIDLLRTARLEHSGGTALDVGCGAGRWCRLLKNSGYEATGIDLQPQLIEKNRKRHPDIHFHCGPLQELETPQPFDLVSSVTVLQHLPYSEQIIAVRKLRELTKTNGHAVILENIRETGPHVFYNSIPQWQTIFKDAGFQVIRIHRYDYSPCFRCHAWLARKIGGGFGQRKENIQDLSPKDFAFVRKEEKSFFHKASDRLRDVAITADWGIEALLVPLNIGIPSLHCGFLFRAV